MRPLSPIGQTRVGPTVLRRYSATTKEDETTSLACTGNPRLVRRSACCCRERVELLVKMTTCPAARRAWKAAIRPLDRLAVMHEDAVYVEKESVIIIEIPWFHRGKRTPIARRMHPAHWPSLLSQRDQCVHQEETDENDQRARSPGGRYLRVAGTFLPN